jgi:hypothetical protein
MLEWPPHKVSMAASLCGYTLSEIGLIFKMKIFNELEEKMDFGKIAIL